MHRIGSQIRSLDLVDYHFNQIKELKKYFIEHTKVSRYEAYKVWSSWIISHRSFDDQEDSFLPSLNLEKDTQIIQHLYQKGCPQKDAIEFYKTIIDKCQETIDNLRSSPIDSTNNINASANAPKIVTLEFLDRENMYVISYNSIKHKITPWLYNKLTKLYMNSRTLLNIAENLLLLLNHYYLLDGLSFQWAIPPEVYDILEKELKVRGELFASPLNCHHANYWSLFEIDRLFGSKGNFFKAKYEDLVSNNNGKFGGVYQVNPPFIEALFIQSSQCILNYLTLAKNDSVSLSFIYFMPNWLDSYGYRLLKDSPYLIDETILRGGTKGCNENGHKHYYYESNEQRYIKVFFDTHILFLSANHNEMKKVWTNTIKNKITRAFKRDIDT